jgi:hypothetical protein
MHSGTAIDRANSQLELANESLARENCCDPHAFVLNI